MGVRVLVRFDNSKGSSNHSILCLNHPLLFCKDFLAGWRREYSFEFESFSDQSSAVFFLHISSSKTMKPDQAQKEDIGYIVIEGIGRPKHDVGHRKKRNDSGGSWTYVRHFSLLFVSSFQVVVVLLLDLIYWYYSSIFIFVQEPVCIYIEMTWMRKKRHPTRTELDIFLFELRIRETEFLNLDKMMTTRITMYVWDVKDTATYQQGVMTHAHASKDFVTSRFDTIVLACRAVRRDSQGWKKKITWS